MLPPGLSFNALSQKALKASKHASLRKSYRNWEPILKFNKVGFFPITPGTNLFYGLYEGIQMLSEEGLPAIFARHKRLSEAARQAVKAWGLEILAKNPHEYSSALTAVLMPEGHSGDEFRKTVLTLGSGLGRVADKVFRIGRLGHFNTLMLSGTLSGVEMGLQVAKIPHQSHGVQVALDYLKKN